MLQNRASNTLYGIMNSKIRICTRFLILLRFWNFVNAFKSSFLIQSGENIHASSLNFGSEKIACIQRSRLSVEKATATIMSEKPLTRLSREKFLALQNGSDVRGISVANERPVTLSPIEAHAIGVGFARWLKLSKNKGVKDLPLRVSVGLDPRITGKVLAEALCCGLEEEGVEVSFFGLCSTPAMFKSCVTAEYEYDAACMVTASHLPFDRNGMKFFTKKGGLNKKQLKQVMEAAAEVYAEAMHPGKFSPADVKNVDFISVYKAQLVAKIRDELSFSGVKYNDFMKPLQGFKIIVNAGNGGGGFFTEILEEVGATTKGSLYLDPNGMFPNNTPNPEDKAAMDTTISAVIKEGANLGIVFDPDVDRCGLVDESGTVINRNRLIALMSSIILREYPESTIVTDSVTSCGLKVFIESLKGKHFRYKKGYKNVIDKALELNSNDTPCYMAIETSGHCALKENFFLDDGAYLAVKVIIEMARMKNFRKKLLDHISRLQEPAESHEFRFTVRPEFEDETRKITSDFADELREAVSRVPLWAPESVNYEGFRAVVFEGDMRLGWLMVRQSLHEPKIILNVESDTVGGIKEIGNTLLSEFLLQMKPQLDISSLESYCESAQS